MALFKTIAECRKYVPSIDANMDFANLKPCIDDAEELFIKDLLGETFYTQLLTDYTEHTDANGVNLAPPNNMNADNLALIPYVQRSLANYAAMFAIDVIGADIGNTGIQESFGTNSRPAPRWKTRRQEERFLHHGDRFAEKLLQYLEKNAGPAKYSAWYADLAANTAMEGFIVHSTRVASLHILINDSRRIFLQLKPKIKEIEQGDIRRILCVDQYDEIVTQIRTGTLTNANKSLIAQLEPFICRKALHETLPYIRVSITHEGLTMHSSTDGVVSKSTATDNTAIGNTAVKKMMERLKGAYEDDRKKIDQFIIDNIDDYPLLKASPCYTSKSTTPPKYVVDNDPDKNHFSV